LIWSWYQPFGFAGTSHRGMQSKKTLG
jgi:hypothetical protein